MESMAEATKVHHVENQNDCDECGAFPNDEARDFYVKSVAPRRELVCPITQECFHDPVVAEGEYLFQCRTVSASLAVRLQASSKA